MAITKTKKKGQTVVKIEGALSVYTANEIHEEMLSIILAGKNDYTVDLIEVEDCDTAGIQLLYSARKMAMEKGIKWSLSGVSDPVKQVAKRVGLADLYEAINTHQEN